MGVKGLWKLLGSCGKRNTPHDLILAIDTSIWIHQYKGMQECDLIYYISKKIIKLLYHNISPVFVFDGPANIFKRNVLEERKKDKIGLLVKNIIDNITCKKCKISIRMCKHGGIKKDDFVINEEINEKWGDFNNENHEDVIEDKNIEKNFHFNNQNNINPINTKDANRKLLRFEDIKNIMKSNEYTQKQKLKMLVKLRETRKNKLEINDTSMINFSISQIKNIKNRNMVSSYIRKLEDNMSKKIQSDCTKSFNIIKDDNKEIKEFDSSDEVDDFLEIKNETINLKKNINETNYFNNEKIVNCKIINDETINLKKNINETNYFNNEKIVNCKIFSENINDGFFGSKKYKEEIFDNQIKFTNETKELNINYKDKLENNTTMDFLSVQSIIKDIINVCNLPYIDSPLESDAQCGYLCKNKIVDGVITEDNDILLHGGIIYKNFFRKNKNILRYDPDEINKELNLSIVDLCKIGYILGSDYTKGIRGIGIKKVKEYLKSQDFLNLNIDSYMNIYQNPVVNENWKPKFRSLDINKLKNYWLKNKIDEDRINELIFYLEKKYNK